MMGRTLGFIISVFGLVACEGGGASVAEDERGSIGPASPASVYCDSLGYTVTGDDCVFPDGSSCDTWSFYRATCGQAFSYCSRQGGTISTRKVDVGDGFAVDTAFCTTAGGKECEEAEYARTKTCD
ncbi:MAG TPA: DUF333 domain-containing protein [Labilithrix sp.]|jgi:putative hemolysin|nr:DUF333 domain-containing protein [Labilithrix sp.]